MSEAESKRIFQKKFNALLDERHVTQKEIALICGASTSTVSTWSKGLNMPRMDKIEKLANYFSLPKSYFIEETEKAPTPEDEREIGLDDFTYAFNGEVRDLTESDKQLLLSMARQLNKARKQRNGKKID